MPTLLIKLPQSICKRARGTSCIYMVIGRDPKDLQGPIAASRAAHKGVPFNFALLLPEISFGVAINRAAVLTTLE